MGKIMSQTLNKKNLIPAIIIVALIAISIGIYFLYKDDNKTEAINYKEYTIHEQHTGKIEEYDPTMTVDGYEGGEKAYYITGKISAKEDKSYSVITFNLYDKNDNLLGTAVAGLNELEKNKIYDFKALSLIKSEDVEKVVRYELEKVELG